MSPLEARMAHLEGAYEQTTHRLAGFDLRFDSLERKIDALRSELIAGNETLRCELTERIDQRFMWTVGLVFGTWATAIVTILIAIVHH